jgi:hypothetical protein
MHLLSSLLVVVALFTLPAHGFMGKRLTHSLTHSLTPVATPTMHRLVSISGGATALAPSQTTVLFDLGTYSLTDLLPPWFIHSFTHSLETHTHLLVYSSANKLKSVLLTSPNNLFNGMFVSLLSVALLWKGIEITSNKVATHSITNSFDTNLTHSPTHSPAEWFEYCQTTKSKELAIKIFNSILVNAHVWLVTRLLIHSLTGSRTYSLTHSLTLLLTNSLAHSLIGPYFYEVYSSKIIKNQVVSLDLVSKLFLIGFASTGIFGPWLGTLLTHSRIHSLTHSLTHAFTHL